jgi:hypothetical protein
MYALSNDGELIPLLGVLVLLKISNDEIGAFMMWTSRVTERQNRQKNSSTKTDIAF